MNERTLESETAGELVEVAPAFGPSTALSMPLPIDYVGASGLHLTAEQGQILAQPIPDDDIDIKPTGEVYASQVRYRRILNHAFGPGGWALLPRGDWLRQGNTLVRSYALFVDGHFVSESYGEQDYIENNPRMSYATACEGAKSNGLVRCCKDLGIASECWDKRFTEKFKAEHCVQVWVEGEKRPQWRRKDSAPFYKESGPVKPQKKPETVERDEPIVLPITEEQEKALLGLIAGCEVLEPKALQKFLDFMGNRLNVIFKAVSDIPASEFVAAQDTLEKHLKNLKLAAAAKKAKEEKGQLPVRIMCEACGMSVPTATFDRHAEECEGSKHAAAMEKQARGKK